MPWVDSTAVRLTATALALSGTPLAPLAFTVTTSPASSGVVREPPFRPRVSSTRTGLCWAKKVDEPFALK